MTDDGLARIAFGATDLYNGAMPPWRRVPDGDQVADAPVDSPGPALLPLPPRRILWAMLATGLLLGLAFRLPGIGEPLWEDELFTHALAAAHPFWAIPAVAAREDIHPPLHHLYMRAWMQLFGYSDLSARSSSLLLAFVGMFVCAWLALRFWGVQAAWAAVLLLATAPGLSYFSQEVRDRMLVSLLVLAGFAALAAARATRSLWWAVAYAAAGAGASYTHYVAGPALAFVNLGFLLTMRRTWRSDLRTLVVGNALVALALLPWLGAFHEQQRGLAAISGGPTRGASAFAWHTFSWITQEDPLMAFDSLLRACGHFNVIAAAGLVVVCAACVLVAIARSSPVANRGLARAALCAALGPPVLMAFLDTLKATGSGGAHYRFLTPLLVLALAAALTPLQAGWRRAVLGALILAQAAALPFNVRKSQAPWDQVAQWLSHSEAPEAMIVSTHSFGPYALRHYGHPAPGVDVPYELPGVEPQRAVRGLFPMLPQDGPRLDRVLAGRSRFWLITPAGDGPLTFAGNPALQDWLRSRGCRPGPVQVFGTVELRLVTRGLSPPPVIGPGSQAPGTPSR